MVLNAKDQFAAIAGDFNEKEHLIGVQYAEIPTFFRELGTIKGTDVLDLGSGSGSYCRLFARRGARKVVGVDASSQMVKQARSTTPSDLLVQYFIADVLTIPKITDFDIVTAVFLLNHASQPTELEDMSRAAARHLRPQGRFAAIIPNPEFDYHRTYDARYGATYARMTDEPRDLHDGDIFTTTIHFTHPAIIQNFYWSEQTYKKALEEAGMKGVKFVAALPSEEGIAAFGTAFWAPYQDNPPVKIVTAHSIQ